MTTINAETLLKMQGWWPARFAMGDLYPAVDFAFVQGGVETSQQEWRTVWPVDELYTFSTIPENMYVSSSSTLDIGRIIFVVGLDAQLNEITGYGITNGQNQSIITTLPGAGVPLEFFRINNALDITPASTKSTAVGDIYIASLTTPVAGVPPVVDTRGMIAQGESRLSGCIYTVPAGHIYAIGWADASQFGDQQIGIRVRGSQILFAGPVVLYLPDIVTRFADIEPGITQLNMDPAFGVFDEGFDITVEAIGSSPVSGTLTLALTGALVNKKYVKNLRIGVTIPSL